MNSLKFVINFTISIIYNQYKNKKMILGFHRIIFLLFIVSIFLIP